VLKGRAFVGEGGAKMLVGFFGGSSRCSAEQVSI
jgi:hypothetical protein